MDDILHLLEKNSINPFELLSVVLQSDETLLRHTHPSLIAHVVSEILEDGVARNSVHEQIMNYAFNVLKEQVSRLTQAESGLHVGPKLSAPEMISAYSMPRLIGLMKHYALDVWPLLLQLLSSNEALSYRRTQYAAARGSASGKEDSGGGAHEYGLTEIKAAVCMSIFAQSSNGKCNALQTLTGIFLHAAGSPETIVKFLAHTGLPISTTTINSTIHRLSDATKLRLKEEGQTFLMMYSYDNIDIAFKHGTPTLELSGNPSLVHLTSATMLRLQDVRTKDLQCAKEIWQKSPYNCQADKSNVKRRRTYNELLDLYPMDPEDTRSRRDVFNVWFMLNELIVNGPAWFRKYAADLKDPEVLIQVPIVKSKQFPLPVMEINPCSASSNVDVIDTILACGGVGNENVVVDGETHLKSIDNHVILVSGDLLSVEHMVHGQLLRSEEETMWGQKGFVVPVMGLFHLKMACANAVWRVHIDAKSAKKDKGSLIEHVACIRPKESGKIQSKPTFRQMHEVIQHVGRAMRKVLWELEIKEENPDIDSLEEYVKLEPTFAQLRAIAARIVEKHVAGNRFGNRLYKKLEDRDLVHENMQLHHQHFLMYEEMTYALNVGDIGRVEDLFVPWALVFLGCGKHNYSRFMLEHLDNLHF